MPSHALRRPSLISRPGTVIALSLVVSTLSVATILQMPRQAMAEQPTSSADPVVRAGAPVTGGAVTSPSLADLESSRLAGAVEQRLERIAERERAEARQRREQRAERAVRQERRAEARAAARAAARAPQWVLPVTGAGWSASFGEAGSAWSSGYHTGQDFTAPSGSPVHAVSAGTITSATWSDAYGNIIEITHPDGDQSWYAHMSGFERTSGSVGAGDVIGYVGCTGNCFGTHLHFEYHPGGGDAADPLAWLRDNGAY